jgi:ankyrin repeat protein
MKCPRIQSTRVKTVLITAVVLIALPSLLIYREIRYQRLNRELIQAIQAHNDDRALKLLRDGADGTATLSDDKPITVRELLGRFINRLLHRPVALRTGQTRCSALLLFYYNGPASDYLPQEPPPPLRENVPIALFDSGSPCEEADIDGRTLVFWAARYHHHSVLRRLVHSGARVNTVCGTLHATPLMAADATDARVLLEHKALTEAADDNGDTALFYADGPKTKLLLEYGAHIDVKGWQGETPLLNACSGGHDSAVQILLTHHASLSARDDLGSTPLLSAASACKLETLQLLTRAGCDVRAKDKNGTTALMLSVDNGDIRVFNWLLGQHIDINAHGVGDCTALSAAEQRYSESVQGGKPSAVYRTMIQRLRKHGAKKGGAENNWFGEEGD